MKFEKKEKNTLVFWGTYTIMYVIFTTILYFILSLTDKLPSTWSYFHVMMITLLIVLTGRLLSLILK